jgi:hypothetical protein
MPDGGRETLLRLARSSLVDLAAVTGTKATEAEWSARIAAADPSLPEKAIATLADYLAVNMPVDEPASSGSDPDAIAATLPADGKQLAIDNCQFCHSFFTGYLVHDRDAEGWRAIFKAPFHTELPMDAKERETFARYSAVNMPIAYEDVPPELRF